MASITIALFLTVSIGLLAAQSRALSDVVIYDINTQVSHFSNSFRHLFLNLLLVVMQFYLNRNYSAILATLQITSYALGV
jgi:hypothetical protein